jgi:hypothetical protein
MRTPIWIEPVKWPDLRKLYTTERRGLLLMTRFWQPGWRDTRRGSAQRGLRGVSCPQPRHCRSISRHASSVSTTPCMTDNIEKVVGLTVYEPDYGVVHFR